MIDKMKKCLFTIVLLLSLIIILPACSNGNNFSETSSNVKSDAETVSETETISEVVSAEPVDESSTIDPEPVITARLTESTVYDITGAATNTTYFYDRNNQLIGQSANKNGDLTVTDFVYENGLLAEKVEAYTAQYSATTTYEYNADGNITVEKTTVDSIAGGPDIERYVVLKVNTYDENGLLIASEIGYEGGNAIVFGEFIYDSEGNRTTNMYEVLDNGERKLTATSVEDQNGKLLSVTYADYSVVYEYDEHGFVEKKTVAYGSDTYGLIYENSYDEYGNLIKAHCVSEPAGMDFTDEYKYDYLT
ncbi:MAG: hypothetical protein J5793_03235 [Clostridia bacterium]|nr:hypothetical protein [Clostridia bacterium]